MPSQYKEPRVCACGFCTSWMSSWSTHKKSCKLVPSGEKQLINNLKEQLAAKDEQLEKKNEQMREQLEAKDKQMKEQLEAKGTVTGKRSANEGTVRGNEGTASGKR